MSDNLARQDEITPEEEKATRMLGAHVNKNLYWAFKKAAAERNEELQTAIAHAANMYIDAVPKKG